MEYKYDSQTAFENFFDWNYFIFKVSALWVPLKPSKFSRICYLLYNSIVIILLIIYQPCESAVMFVNPSLDIFLRSLRDQFNHLMCFYKITRWYGHRDTIVSIIETLQHPDYTYDECGLFSSKQIVNKYKKQADRWMLIFLAFVNAICYSMLFSGLYLFIFKSEELYKIDENGRQIYVQPLPITLITPIENVTKTTFLCHLLFQVYCGDMHAWMIVGLDGMFTSLMACVSAHLDILQEAFTTIRPRCLKRFNMIDDDCLLDPPEIQDSMLDESKKCIKHLNMLFWASEKMEEIYNIQTCGQVLTSLFEMCLCLYFLSSAISEDAPAEFAYFISTTFELFLYCWFGNAVTTSSIAIADAIYNGDWYSSGKSFKSNMLITMTRMRKPIYLTIGKFSPLTYTTFLSISRVAYSFFTVLKGEGS